MALGVVRLEPDHLAAIGDRLIDLSLRPQDDTPRFVSPNVVGLDPDRFLARSARLTELALADQASGEARAHVGARWVDPACDTELLHRFLGLPLAPQEVCEVLVTRMIVRLKLNGGAVLGDGFIQLALLRIGRGKRAMRAVVGLDPHRFADHGDRFVRLATFDQGVGERPVVPGFIRPEADALAVLGDRLVEFSNGRKSAAEVGMGPAIIGPLANHVSELRDRGFKYSTGFPTTAALLEGLTQAHQMTPIVRTQSRQVPKDRNRIRPLTSEVQGMSQVMARLGPDRAGRRVVANRFFSPGELLQAQGQMIVELEVARVALLRLS